MEIKFVQQQDIDRLKWDSCVHYATNGNVFGYKWFLDAVAKDWDGLVENDYESVFPLTWTDGLFNSKQLHQPILIRELGVYSVNALSPARIKAFLDAIPPHYKKIKMQLNEQNRLTDYDKFKWQSKKNYQLLLKEPYETLRQSYDARLIEQLKIADDARLFPNSNLKPEKLAAFYKAHGAYDRWKEQKFHALQRIMYNAMHRGIGFFTGIQNKAGELLAVNFFISSHSKLLSLLPLASKAGKAVHALSYLMDMVIRTNAGRSIIMDFNDEQDIWKYFGALPNDYYQINKGNLLGI